MDVVGSLLDDRIFEGWQVDGSRYDMMTSCYVFVCSNGATTVQVKLMSEHFDAVEKNNDKFKRRPIRRAFKQAFKIELTPDD